MSDNLNADERIKRQRREWALKRQAVETAKRRLEAEGVSYPVFNGKESMVDYYARLQIYAQKESAYILEAMRMPSGPRPVVEYKDYYDTDKDR